MTPHIIPDGHPADNGDEPVLDGAIIRHQFTVAWKGDKIVIDRGTRGRFELDPGEARSIAYFLTQFADYFNTPDQCRLRRPIDYCAEPDLDGIGGGL